MPDLAAALTLHRSGHLEPAARLYEEVLLEEKENADALHLLGVIHHQRGDNARALELIGRAVALRPSVPVFHANLAEVYRALGKLDRAAGCCRTALRLDPQSVDALTNLGLVLSAQGKHAEAVDMLRRALQTQPGSPVIHNNLALALREVKQFDEALEHFRKAVELDPTYALAQNNLGQALVDKGQAAEGLPHCQEAVRLDPERAAFHHNLGNALRALDRLVEARAAFLEALRLDQSLAVAHAHVGLTLHQDGELDDALPWLRQAVELAPADALCWEYLAELQTEREDAEALACWQKAVALAPQKVGPRLGLGWVLQDEGKPAEAGEHYRAALALEPEAAGAHLNLAGLHEELGELNQAEASLRTALQLQPLYAAAHAQLATLLRGKLPVEDQAALEQRLADPALSPQPRARLLFSLAHALDGRGDYTRAAACLREANALRRERAKGRRFYDPADHELLVENLVQGFEPDFFERMRGMGLATRRPVFVFGLPRSGTTLIEQVLASHSQMHGAGELRLARQSFEAIPEVTGQTTRPLECLAHLNAAAVQELARKHLAQLDARDGGKAARVVDKMPDNYLYLGLLATLFPQATFIHCRRDLRDIAVSCWMTDFRSIPWANDPSHIARRFQQYRRLAEHWRGVLPVQVLEVDYEETVTDLEAVARRLVAACGLAWEPSCLRFHENRRPVRTASVVQVRQPVYRSSLARWKHYEPELADLIAALPR